MTALSGLGQKIMEWAVIAALVGVIGYLVGNSDAMTMKAQIERLRDDVDRHERDRLALEARLREVLSARRGFMNGAAGPLNYLCEKDAGCSARFSSLSVPE